MNVAHASLDSDSHTKHLITLHRRIEDMVHAQMRLANASMEKIWRLFVWLNAMQVLFMSHAMVGQLGSDVQELSLLDLFLFWSNIE